MAEDTTLRDALTEAYEKAETPLPVADNATPAEIETPAPEQPDSDAKRDDSGRFVKKSDKPEPKVTEKPAEVKDTKVDVSTEPAKQEKLPSGWSGDAKAKFGELPDWAKKEVLRREDDIHKAMTRNDSDMNFGRGMKDVFAPYQAQLKANGVTPEVITADLMNTVYQLANGSQQQKQQVLMSIAKSYGVDTNFMAQSNNAPVDPAVASLQQELNALKSQQQMRDQQAQQIEDGKAQDAIGAFASDPANVYFDEVKPIMAQLLTSGQAVDLKDAYDKATWSNPTIRASLLAAEKAQALQSQAEKTAESVARKTDAARYASGSVSGSPGNVAIPESKPNRSLRDELTAQFDAVTARGY